MTASPLIIGETQRRALVALREKAAADPVDMLAVAELIKTPEGKQRHMRRMALLTIELPTAFAVTYTIETGHPAGACRHMSMSSDREGRVPTPEAVWMVCEELGFVGGFNDCQVWPEELVRGPNGERSIAFNVVQPLRVEGEARA